MRSVKANRKLYRFVAQIGFLAAILDLISHGSSAAQFVVRFFDPPAGLANVSVPVKVQAILVLGLLAALCHLILWALTEIILGSDFGAGGDALPQGSVAVVQSFTITVPLLLLPPLYAGLTHTQIVLRGHMLAAGFVLVFAAVGHLLLYGSKAFHFED